MTIGNKAPAFKLPASNGETIDLSDYKGKKVVLYFYPRADTPGCTAEGKGFRDRFDKVKGNAEIAGVSVDPPEMNKAFAQKYQFPFRLLSDPSREMCVAYGACADTSAKYAERITYIIDSNGKIEHAEKVSDIAAHVDDAVGRVCGIGTH